MADINSMISDTTTSTTTLPSWYDQASQNVVNQAQAGAGQVPLLENTVAGNAINRLSGDQNPFNQAQSTLQSIGTGAANPWYVDPSSGAVTPNTSTALGGLFQAQNQQLQQMLPNITAPVNASAIASGGFGGLRNMTARDKAIGDAQADLFSKQMQAALQNQQTGVQAGSALSNLGSEATATETTMGQAQQASPLTSVANLAQILGNVKAPATVTQSAQLSPLSQIGALGSALSGGINGTNSLLTNLFGSNASIANLLKSAYGGVTDLFSGWGDDSYVADQLDNNTDYSDLTDDQIADWGSEGFDTSGGVNFNSGDSFGG